MNSDHPDKHLYRPGKIILLTLWVFFTGLSLYLTPTADLFGAGIAGFLLAAICALTTAIVAAVLFRLAANCVGLLRRVRTRRAMTATHKHLSKAGVPMKDSSVIPAGDFCYSLVPIGEGEILSSDIERFGKDLREYPYHPGWKEILCPYWQRSDYGMVVCTYLDVQTLDEWDETARSKAIAHFGSVEAMSQACGSSFLHDEVKICEINVEE